MSIEYEIKKFSEYELSEDQHSQIEKLWNICFKDKHLKRSYFKQLPHFRFLVMNNTKIIGQLGVDFRVFSINAEPLKVLGVIDLCVHPDFQNQGIASKLIEELESLALDNQINYLLLIADDDRIYKKHNFRYINEYCTWLRIDEHRNYGVTFEKLENELMIKCLKGKPWPTGPIDFLGYMY